ncbi:4-(cytidine 5'-diphospho)-2-C-methyl-D-erythritol kinase [Athalassotoga saccharophila]|uniref:4-(cytidine 5'-diphospho)-2-C-methyl-D-erythritol kinase n=1 Tax=Athalassotoga saccharophila TaxID=1441386 RepID=UPI0013797499|nr:4-(cytidine 5'-diphospho)-2-C-methyl-D-erythritol kinase [Athalassotoga saccharophila]BBJ28249.1 4-diphosphocytidyl-2-C-methyl-D-erythritol kinase [Athalassotoga saccharophila]
MIIKAYAKVNLNLSVLSKRTDGLHDICSLMHNISLYDLIEIEESDELSFSTNSDLKWNESNTLYKTLKIFEELTGKSYNLKIRLEKHIPSPSGLGGGSADAAALLWYLCQREGISEMKEIAAKIGSDVPFFIDGGCAVVEGKGDRIHNLDPLDLNLEIYFPKIGFSTKEMYDLVDEMNLTGKNCDPYMLYDGIKRKDEKNVRENLYNTFKIVAQKKYPDIVEEAMKAFADMEYVSMSGSGSAFFGFNLKNKPKGDVQLVARPRLIL